MNKHFWLIFAVTTATAAAEAVILVSGLSEPQKKALNDLIAASQEVTAVF